jgi:HSP20 family molecular chaperone IbpA
MSLMCSSTRRIAIPDRLTNLTNLRARSTVCRRPRTSPRKLNSSPVGPGFDVYEDKDNLIVKAELPGMKKEQIELSADNTLTIAGERKSEQRKATGRSRAERFRSLSAHRDITKNRRSEQRQRPV